MKPISVENDEMNDWFDLVGVNANDDVLSDAGEILLLV